MSQSIDYVIICAIMDRSQTPETEEIAPIYFKFDNSEDAWEAARAFWRWQNETDVSPSTFIINAADFAEVSLGPGSLADQELFAKFCAEHFPGTFTSHDKPQSDPDQFI